MAYLWFFLAFFCSGKLEWVEIGREHTKGRTMQNEVNPNQIGVFLGKVPAVISEKCLEAGVFYNRELMQEGIKDPRRLAEILHDLYAPKVVTPAEWRNTLEYYADLYKRLYSLTPELKGVRPFAHVPAGYRIYIVGEGLTQNGMIESMRDRFTVWTYADDLDKDIPIHDQHPRRGSYAVAFKDVVEADKDLKDLSADQLRTMLHVKPTTTFERFVMEDECFDRTKGHLDVQNVTLCAGSRFRVGSVPRAYWRGGRFYVVWCDSGGAYPSGRARAAVFPS